MTKAPPSRIAAAAIGATLAFGGGLAWADGVVVSPSDLAPRARAVMLSEIAAARAADPESFAALAAIDSYKPEGIRFSRHNGPSAARALMRLGPRGLWPMIEWAAFHAERGSLNDEQWRSLGAGLLQALGVLMDSRTEPVLRAAFDGARDPLWVVRAGEGLGMLCGTDQEKLLLAASAGREPQRQAAIAGLGHCRTPRTVRRLAAILRNEDPDSQTTARAVRALGYVGSSWALTADKRIPPELADEIRKVAAEALVGALPRQGDRSARKATARSVRMVEHPIAIERLATAEQVATGELRDELKRLRRSLEHGLDRR